MRDLHVVALSEDGRHVVLATTADAKRGGFRVALDDRLQAAVKGELSRGGRVPSETMSVREIQARLRAGASVDDLARAGVPLARVERFAGPVLSERAQVVDKARKAVLVRGRRGPSALPLGEAVDLRLSELPSMRADSVVWTSWKGDDGVWTVEVSWYSRGRTRTAQWRYDLGARTVVAVDPGSASLGHVDGEGRPADGDGPAPPSRPVRTGDRAKGDRTRGGRGSTAAAAGPSSASDRPRGPGTSRPTTSRPGTSRPGEDDDADVDVEADDEPGPAARARGTRTTAPRRTAGSGSRRTATPAASVRTADRSGGGRARAGAGARAWAGEPGDTDRPATRPTPSAPPSSGRAPGDVPAGARDSAPRPSAARGTTTPGAVGGGPAARQPAAPSAGAPGVRGSGAAARRTTVPGQTAAAPGRQPVVRRAAPAPFGPAAVAAVRRPPASPRPAVPLAPARTPPTAAAGPAPSSPPRVVTGRTGLVVPAPGRRDVEPERPSELARPVGPPSLRVVPRPADDVEHEQAADVS